MQLFCASSLMPFLPAGCSDGVRARVFSAAQIANASYMAGFAVNGDLVFATKVNERLHGIACNPYLKHLSWAARSPRTRLYISDTSGQILQTINADNNRHFYGHSQYSQDGRWLYVPQNDIATGTGRIAVYDVQHQYKQIADWSSAGIGPHEIRLLSDGIHLLVANGGLRTHPKKSGILNLDDLAPNLSIINTLTGKTQQTLQLPDKGLSIRHLALNKKDQLALLTQYQYKDQILPLVYLWQPGMTILQEVEEPSIAEQGWPGFNKYVASGILTDNGLLMVSTPKGNAIYSWKLHTEEDKRIGSQFLMRYPFKDAAGLALNADQSEVLASTGQGYLQAFNAVTAQPLWQQPRWQEGTGWDNHMLAI